VSAGTKAVDARCGGDRWLQSASTRRWRPAVPQGLIRRQGQRERLDVRGAEATAIVATAADPVFRLKRDFAAWIAWCRFNRACGSSGRSPSGGTATCTHVSHGPTIAGLLHESKIAPEQRLHQIELRCPHRRVSFGGVISNTLDSGGTINISSGGSAVSTTVTSGGTEHVSSGGEAVSTTISGGGFQYVNGGTTEDTTILSGGTDFVSSGGIDYYAQIGGGGKEVVSQGGTAWAPNVSSGGVVNVLSGGFAIHPFRRRHRGHLLGRHSPRLSTVAARSLSPPETQPSRPR
jgi:autotransporter passenger strand-loop-strand repeat protein